MALVKCPECSGTVSDKAITCPHCGNPLDHNKNETILSNENVATIATINKREKVNKSKKIIIFGLFIILIILIISTIFSISRHSKDERISRVYLTEGYDAAVELIYKYYGTSDKAISWMIVITEDSNHNIIDNVNILEDSLLLYDNHYYFDATVKNNSDETLKYIQIDIFLTDNNGDVIDSKWTNWSGTLIPGATAKLDTMIEYDSKISGYIVQVSDVSIK
ncbi:MAG: hypothetical protein JXN65_06640 [Clostridia bacterium]|nr:hypothetical protein [Clostridia bacterium]